MLHSSKASLKRPFSAAKLIALSRSEGVGEAATGAGYHLLGAGQHIDSGPRWLNGGLMELHSRTGQERCLSEDQWVFQVLW